MLLWTNLAPRLLVFRIKIIQVCIISSRAGDRYFEWEVVFDGTVPEKTGPNFKGPGKCFRHQIITKFFCMHITDKVIFKMHI